MFDEKTRYAIRQNEAGFGNALAGRGPQLNAAFGTLRKLAESAEATAPQPGLALDRLRRLLAGAGGLQRHRRPGRRDQRHPLRRPRPDLRRLRPRLPALHPGNDLEGPARPSTPRSKTCRSIDPFLQSSERFFTAFKPGAKALAESSPILNAAEVAGIPVLKASPIFDAQLEPTADALLAFQEAPGRLQRPRPADRHQRSPQPGDQVHRARRRRRATT